MVVLEKANIPQALIEFAKQEGITHMIMGRSTQRRWFSMRPNVLNAVMRGLPQVDFVIV